MFSAQTYINRRQKLKQQVGSGIILLPGNDEAAMNYPDNPYPFRQDSTFLYFFGIDSPGLTGVIDIDNNTDMIFGDDLTIEDIVWTGPQPTVADKAAQVGVKETRPLDKLGGFVSDCKKQERAVHYLSLYRGDTVLMLTELLGINADQLKADVSEDLIRAVVAQRSFKSDEEISEIETAVNVCCQMQILAMKLAKPGLYEKEIAGAMEGLVVSNGLRLSFPTILTVHGETLHNHYYGNVMQDGDIIINDSGSESPLHYAGDITRTIPVSGNFDQRQKDIYNIVLDSQSAAIEAVKPGVMFRDIHLLSCEILASGLKDLGLMRGDVKEAVAVGAHALFFQCGLGHMMGLDIHDMEGLGENFVGYTDEIIRSNQFGLKSLRLAKQLEAGFVITVEPGIYLIPQLIDMWKSENKFTEFINYNEVEKFRDFGGVRVEDDLLVTKSGYRILGKHIPRTIQEVEDTCRN